MNMSELRNEAMSFDVAEMRPVYVGTSTTPEKNFRALVNTTKNHTAAIVGPIYREAQHRDVVVDVADAITNLNIKADARVRDSGDRLAVDIEFTDSRLYVQKGEDFIVGVRIVNSYDKSTGISIQGRLVRLACSNGMVMNERLVHGFSITHTSKRVAELTRRIPQMISDMVASNEKFKAMINNCIGDSIEWELMDKIVSKLVTGRKKHAEEISKLVREYCKGEQPTRWDLYNAFTHYATHGEQIKPTIEAWLQNKAQIALEMPLATLVPEVEQ